MDDVEIVESTGDLQVKLQELQDQREEERASMMDEMRVLIMDMDSVLKERSDSERSQNAVRRKMERNLADCKEVIDRLGNELNASERAMLKLRTDFRACQTRESMQTSTISSLKSEVASLTKKAADLTDSNASLNKKLEEEKKKQQASDYLKDYVEFLEEELKKLKAKKEQSEFKEKVVQQLNTDHAASIQKLKDIHEETIVKLKSDHAISLCNLKKKSESHLVKKSLQQTTSASRLSKGKNSNSTNNYFVGNQKGATTSSVVEEIEDYTGEFESDTDDDYDSFEYSSSSSTQSNNLAWLTQHSATQQLSRKSDESERQSSTSSQSIEGEMEAMRKELKNWEELLRTIDIHTYLTQIENQVDELHEKNMFEPRNIILKQQIELSLRGIRQLCDYHSIEMEYII